MYHVQHGICKVLFIFKAEYKSVEQPYNKHTLTTYPLRIENIFPFLSKNVNRKQYAIRKHNKLRDMCRNTIIIFLLKPFYYIETHNKYVMKLIACINK